VLLHKSVDAWKFLQALAGISFFGSEVSKRRYVVVDALRRQSSVPDQAEKSGSKEAILTQDFPGCRRVVPWFYRGGLFRDQRSVLFFS
jgi:hypothetical protein